ncbi:hypothetical protein KIL84_000644 [Mauremys mutica]|uniref:ADF-H domain-containing protein n=1 Tax=Mauremys mutica TaxID=74926 RepID=A0A9D3WSY9_9SAUR|nr:hypothetical protein KIL84_000644 [Mauremys mutica]
MRGTVLVFGGNMHNNISRSQGANCRSSDSLAFDIDCAPLKSKMIYASSKDAIKKKLTGIKHELQATCYEEVKDRCTLAQKLGGNAVVSLEGKPL